MNKFVLPKQYEKATSSCVSGVKMYWKKYRYFIKSRDTVYMQKQNNLLRWRFRFHPA
jgi:hypothetical protein